MRRLLRRRADVVEPVPFWYHSIDLGDGVVTPGMKSPESMAAHLAALDLPDLSGKSFLDVGAWDGFFSFEAERRGARRVVALDSYEWTGTPPGWEGRRERLPPKRTGFDLAHSRLRSSVECVVGDFMTIDLESLGTFDVVLFSGVLYHLEEPLTALRRLAAVTDELAIVETAAVHTGALEKHAVCEFYEGDELNADETNWWAPNAPALAAMCRAAGFTRVDPLGYPPAATSAPVTRYRLVAHAWR
jgi:tRNA (mo5U34)-methyltransferase